MKRAIIINNAMEQTMQRIVQIRMWIIIKFASAKMVICILKEDALKVFLSVALSIIVMHSCQGKTK